MVFLLEGSIVSVLLLVDSEIGLGGVALLADVTLKWLLSGVDSNVALIFSLSVKCFITLWTLQGLLVGAFDDQRS